MIPKIDGFTLIKMIEDKNIPVIFLSAKSQVQDKILGLKLGAEDYNNIEYHHITIQPNERIVKSKGEIVYLTVKEYNLLIMFIDNINNVLTREVILEKIWGYDFLGETRTVDMHVKQLRDKLDLKDYLKTIYKVGYILKS